jgi:uncharacterized OB-fold protein
MEFPYTRTVGPVVGRFLGGLRDRRIEGLRTSTGQVLVPPTGYDPQTSQALDAWVTVGEEGVVTTWTWVEQVTDGQPLARPFAWALIRLDGADTALLHAVDVPAASAMKSGMRVRVRWAHQPVGHIRDIECFEPVP